MEKAMAQAGVEWNREEASKTRADKWQRLSRRSYPGRPIAPNGNGISTTDWLPLPALLGLVLAGFGGYFVAEAALAASAHPVHWSGTVLRQHGRLLGGIVWHRLRGF